MMDRTDCRTAGRGRIANPQHMLEATLDEMCALVAGTGGPSAAELAECRGFLRSQAELLSDSQKLTQIAGGPKAMVPPSTDPRQRARENLALVLYNHNDFITIR